MLSVGTTFYITSGAPLFVAQDIGRQIWQKYQNDGSGGQRATITDFISATQIQCEALTEWDETLTLASGDWEFAIKDVKNLFLFEGLTVQVQADGGGHPDCTVSGGAISLDYYASNIKAGFKYTGLMIGQNLDFGSLRGPANSKFRNIKQIHARFADTIGCQIGTSEYKLEEVVFNQDSSPLGRVPPPFSGVADVRQMDNWDDSEKRFSVFHDDPTPCTILALDLEMMTNDPP